jgi:hypothetical protein
MEALLPAATAVDAAGAALSLLVYVLVGVSALTAAPRDLRTRLFLLIALANIAPYGLTIASWRGMPFDQIPRWGWVALLASLGIGVVALLHFFQVFPWRRPWILRYGRWLYALYAGSALIAVWLVVSAPADLLDPPVFYSIELLMLGLPWLFGVLVAMPFAGLFSLYKTRQESVSRHAGGARETTTLMLVSQVTGGVLAVLVIPLVRGVIPNSGLVTAASVLLAASGLLMPIAFALGVWKYRVLDVAGT